MVLLVNVSLIRLSAALYFYCMSLHLRWISATSPLIYSFIHSENLSLMSVYKLFTFKVMIYIIGLMPTIFVTAFYLLNLFLLLIFIPLFLCILWFYLNICMNPFSHFSLPVNCTSFNFLFKVGSRV